MSKQIKQKAWVGVDNYGEAIPHKISRSAYKCASMVTFDDGKAKMKYERFDRNIRPCTITIELNEES